MWYSWAVAAHVSWAECSRPSSNKCQMWGWILQLQNKACYVALQNVSHIFGFYLHDCTSHSQIWLLLVWVYEDFFIRGPAHMLDLYIKSVLTVSDMESLQVVESQGADSASNYKHPNPTVSRASLHPKVCLWKHVLIVQVKSLILCGKLSRW